mmetsp:Transcript_19609/g.18691  ORF Transcript_19609/g.18691 Transcript_19609/m.18691 type:complete len:120 (+) Transcript_19609:1486-1845(+)
MSADTRSFFQSFCMNVFNGYGMTETAAAVTFHENDLEVSKPGRPLPGTEIKIFNPNEGGVGEVCMKGRNVFMGYLKDEEATKEVFDGKGFYHSGEKGLIDGDGCLQILGKIEEQQLAKL